MYINSKTVEELIKKYGKPKEVTIQEEFEERAYKVLRGSMTDDRAHDVTFFIMDTCKVAVIRKPSFPPETFRVPSGGVKKGELFEDGLKREAYEETGLIVDVSRFLLKVNAIFTYNGDLTNWTSYVFETKFAGGTLSHLDTKEIAECRWVTLNELNTTLMDKLYQSGLAGLRYRAKLTEFALAELYSEYKNCLDAK